MRKHTTKDFTKPLSDEKLTVEWNRTVASMKLTDRLLKIQELVMVSTPNTKTYASKPAAIRSNSNLKTTTSSTMSSNNNNNYTSKSHSKSTFPSQHQYELQINDLFDIQRQQIRNAITQRTDLKIEEERKSERSKRLLIFEKEIISFLSLEREITDNKFHRSTNQRMDPNSTTTCDENK